MRVLLLMIILFLFSCGSTTGTEPEPGSEANVASAELVELNQSAAQAMATASELAELVLGPGGIAERAQATRTLPLSTVAEIQAWRSERDALRAQLEFAGPKGAQFALDLAAVERNRRTFLANQMLYFPVWPEDTANNPQGLTTVQQPLVVAALAIATLTIGGYRFLKGFGELADNTQRMVYTTAEGGPNSRAALIQILKDNGVEVSDMASAEEVIEIFDTQPRDVRRTITTQVEAWNEDAFAAGGEDAEDALDRFEEAREDVPEISNEGGALAVTQTVSFVQSVTGGVGNVVGGVPGAVIDLTLTATEKNPTDIIQRNVTVFVTAGEKEDLPTQTSPTSPTVALETIEKAAAGDPSINPEQIVDAATALIQELAEGLRSTFGPSVQIAQRFALSGGTLTEEPQEDGTFKQNVSLPLTHFRSGEAAEVVIVREGMLAQEVLNYALGVDPPIVLDTPPLLGTITVESAAGTASAESQLFDVMATLIRVPQVTELICQGTNVVCSPTVSPVATDGTTTFSVEVFGRGELRLIRRDTGESYALNLTAASSEPEPEPTNNTQTNLDPALYGTWTFVDSEGEEYFWRFNADGSCTQGTPVGNSEWKWTIENGLLKLYLDNATPAFKKYKIEGSLLYFWVDVIEDWSFPFEHGT